MDIEKALKRVKPKLVNLTKTAESKRIEYGAIFCRVGDEIKIEEVRGGKGKIKLIPFCREGEYVGDFHTHAWDEEKVDFLEFFRPVFKERTAEIVRDVFVLKPSVNDIVLSIHHDADIFCIGSLKEPGSDDVVIKCYVPDKTHNKYRELHNKIEEVAKLTDVKEIKKELIEMGGEVKKVFSEFTHSFIL